MKVILSFLAMLPAFFATAQYNRQDFSAIDRRALAVDGSSVPALSQELTSGLATDLEKARAIFRWITDNISYRTSFPKKKDSYNRETDDDTAALKPLDERVAISVLEARTALCDGYARLFKTMCLYSGLEAETIQGYARTESFRRIQRFRPNHTWNAVRIDSTWYLLDIAWASGYISMPGNDFIKSLDEQYFLSKPEQFIREHYPDDLSWTLMDNPPLLPEFKASPYLQKSFIKYKIRQYSPSVGLLNVRLGDTIRLQVETRDILADRMISSDPFLEKDVFNTATRALAEPYTFNGNTTDYLYIVKSASVQWLYVLYNNDVILRYRLNVDAMALQSVAER